MDGPAEVAAPALVAPNPGLIPAWLETARRAAGKRATEYTGPEMRVMTETLLMATWEPGSPGPRTQRLGSVTQMLRQPPTEYR